MTDLVAMLRRAQRLCASLSDTEYAWLLVALRSLRPHALPPLSTNAERQRRFRAGRAGVTRNVMDNSNSNVTRDVTANVTSNVTERYAIPPHPPKVSSISKSLAFESFWKVYPKHVGKGEALKAWNKGNCESTADGITASVERQMAYLTREDGKYTPLPATWLNQKRWDDDPPQSSLLSEKGAKNVDSIRAWVEGMNHDAK